jgi:hypothetical protein
LNDNQSGLESVRRMNPSKSPLAQEANLRGSSPKDGPSISITSVVEQSQSPSQPSKPSPVSALAAMQSRQSIDRHTNALAIPTEQKGITEDVNMEDDEDDLYGPLPEEVQLVPRRDKQPPLEMEIDDVENNAKQSDSVSEIVEQPLNKSTNSKPAISWMHGRFAYVAGDPWDRLQRRKRRPVANLSRAKVKAKKLDCNTPTSVDNLVNFSIEDWINMRKGK